MEDRKKTLKPPYVWSFDIDSTITAAPQQYARLATALQAQGDKIVCVTGHGPKQTRKELLDTLGFPYDEIIIVDPGDVGKGKAKALKHLDAFMHFDDRLEFGPEIIKICPVAFQYVEPPGDDHPKQDAKKAAKALKRCLLVGGSHDGEWFEHRGLSDLLDVDGETYRVQLEPPRFSDAPALTLDDEYGWALHLTPMNQRSSVF